MYAGSDEIKSYFKHFATKYELWSYIKVNNKVTRAEWNDDAGEWNVVVEDTVSGHIESYTCDIFVNASGILNNWRWPTIPGLQNFKGALLHSAHYDRDCDLTGKRVGLIGNGYVR